MIASLTDSDSFFSELDYITIGEVSCICQIINRFPLDIGKKIVSSPAAYNTFLELSLDGHVSRVTRKVSHVTMATF